jgi:hypothetical protein
MDQIYFEVTMYVNGYRLPTTRVDVPQGLSLQYPELLNAQRKLERVQYQNQIEEARHEIALLKRKGVSIFNRKSKKVK